MKSRLLAVWRFLREWGPGTLACLGAAAIFVVLSIACASCTSGTKDISRSATTTAMLAGHIEEHAKALEPLVADNPEASKHVKAIEQDAKDIVVETNKTREALTKVKDVTPWWATAVENLTWILLGFGILFALFYFGLAAPIRAFFVFIGSFIPAILPSKVKSAAKLDAEALETAPTPELDKSVAIRRASDPMYDAAWKARKRAEKKA